MVDQFSSTGFEPSGSIWPEYVPKDLELRLLNALSYRNCSQADIWDEVKSWLEENHIKPTEMVHQQRTSPEMRPRGCTKYPPET
jgi:hypothetical protein